MDQIDELKGLQDKLYETLNSRPHHKLKQDEVISIAFNDVLLNIRRNCIFAMYRVGLTKSLFSSKSLYSKFTSGKVLVSTENTLFALISIPVRIMVAPLKMIHQIGAINMNSEKVQSINFQNPTFKN